MDDTAIVDDSEVASIAAQLLHSYESGTTLDPLTASRPHLTVDDAYRIQSAQVADWIASGRVERGHKVGLTSVAIQRQLGVDQPDYGRLFADMFHLDGEAILAGTYLQPRVEPEISFVLKERLLGGGLTVADAVRAVDHVIGSLEIIDSRIADWKITLPDTIADNASSGGVVLGTVARRLEDVDLRLIGVNLRRNGTIVQTGAGGAVLGSPLNSFVWLANTLGARGVALEPGAVILAGALTAAVPAAPGDVISAEFAGLGTVVARFGRESGASR